MSHVIRLLAIAGQHYPGSDTAIQPGMFLAKWDFDFNGGMGAAWWTDKLEEAHRFADVMEAFKTYRTQSTLMPTRPWDGQPNRPLTLYTIEVLSVEAAEADLLRSKTGGN